MTGEFRESGVVDPQASTPCTRSSTASGIRAAAPGHSLDQNEKQFQLVGNLTKLLGTHSFKFGIDVRRAYNLRVPSDRHRSGGPPLELGDQVALLGRSQPARDVDRPGRDLARLARSVQVEQRHAAARDSSSSSVRLASRPPR